ncbi:MAG: CBS domain-containing protein [Deltaproteobacteria bacterium]|nr:CBS domain-containing protein [Deltaproteobacteria bacterium]
MDKILVKDLMVPLDEYASVSHEATLYDAVLALEKAQEEIDRTRYSYLHRAVLVFDENKKIVGKVSQLDALRALEPKYNQIGEPRSLSLAGFSPNFLKSMLEQYSLLSEPFGEICRKAAQVKVKTFMYTLSEGEYLEENATLKEAINQFVMGRHQSLLVKRGETIVGVLRLTDVFKHVFQTMKTTCSI